jgi:hypothetical protein
MPTPEQKKILEKAAKQAKGAWKKSRTKEPVVGGGLPAGITGGIARIADYKFGEKDGKVSLSLSGIVVRPEEYAGQRATKMHFLSDSEYNTIEEAYDGLYSDLKLLGVDTTDSAHEDLAQILDDLEELKEEKRAFKFNTWKGNSPNARVKVFIQGLPDEDELAEIEGDELEDQGDDGEGEEPEEESEGDDGEGEEEPAEDEGEFLPAKGEEYGWMYKANPKARAKKVNVVIKTVNKSKSTVTFENPAGKTVTASFDDLLDAIDEAA